MAGIVRQPIDVDALTRFISDNVPEIKIPIDLKQVFHPSYQTTQVCLTVFVVRVRAIQSNIPNHRCRWQKIRDAKEASGKTGIQDRASS